jgi:hypothetical protein
MSSPVSDSCPGAGREGVTERCGRRWAAQPGRLAQQPESYARLSSALTPAISPWPSSPAAQKGRRGIAGLATCSSVSAPAPSSRRPEGTA